MFWTCISSNKIIFSSKVNKRQDHKYRRIILLFGKNIWDNGFIFHLEVLLLQTLFLSGYPFSFYLFIIFIIINIKKQKKNIYYVYRSTPTRKHEKYALYQDSNLLDPACFNPLGHGERNGPATFYLLF